MYRNQIELAGNVGNVPELKMVGTDGDTPMVNVSLAYNDYRKKGEDDETLWFRVTFWNKTAERFVEYVKQGQNVFVDGSIEAPYLYQDKKTDEWRASLQVRGFQWSFTGRKSDELSDDTDEDVVAI